MSYQDIVEKRGIHRLCHFTHIRNLPNILLDGILASNCEGIEKNDPDRWDGHPDYVCTSVEFPNTFYLHQAVGRTNTRIEDWVILEINTRVLNDDGLFCPVNAAKDKGAHLASGIEAFDKLFAPYIDINNRERDRSWESCAPTDLQAEVLIFDRIEVEDIKGIIFHTNYDRQLCPCNIPPRIRLRHSIDLFERYGVSNWLNRGRIPFDFPLD